MTPEREKELRELCEKATPGDWSMWQSPDGPTVKIVWRNKENLRCTTFFGPFREADDARFVAAARTAIPELLDEIERLTVDRDAAISRAEKAASEQRQSDAKIDDVCQQRDAAVAENARLREALAPSAATKHAYFGEFKFYFETAEEGIKVDVPWTTIKEIMAAILARALNKDTDNDQG
jgi:hypothetical protein